MGKKGIIFVILLGVSLFLEWMALSIFFREAFGLSPRVILYHLSASLFFSLACWSVKGNFAYMGAVLCLCLSLLGILIGTTFVLAYAIVQRGKGLLYKEYYSHIRQTTVGRKISPKSFYQHSNAIPLFDYARSRNTSVRISALRAAGSLGDRESIKALFLGSHDIHPDVRIQAIAELVRLKEFYEKEITAARHCVQRREEDFSSHNILANIALEYFEYKLTDDKNYLNLAEREYKRSWSLQKNQVDVCNRLGHISLLKDNSEEGLRWYAQAAKLAPENLWAGIGVMECYWRMGAYEKLPILARKILDNNPRPSRFQDILSFWLNENGSQENADKQNRK